MKKRSKFDLILCLSGSGEKLANYKENGVAKWWRGSTLARHEAGVK